MIQAIKNKMREREKLALFKRGLKLLARYEKELSKTYDERDHALISAIHYELGVIDDAIKRCGT